MALINRQAKILGKLGGRPKLPKNTETAKHKTFNGALSSFKPIFKHKTAKHG